MSFVELDGAFHPLERLGWPTSSFALTQLQFYRRDPRIAARRVQLRSGPCRELHRGGGTVLLDLAPGAPVPDALPAAIGSAA